MLNVPEARSHGEFLKAALISIAKATGLTVRELVSDPLTVVSARVSEKRAHGARRYRRRYKRNRPRFVPREIVR